MGPVSNQVLRGSSDVTRVVVGGANGGFVPKSAPSRLLFPPLHHHHLLLLLLLLRFFFAVLPGYLFFHLLVWFAFGRWLRDRGGGEGGISNAMSNVSLEKNINILVFLFKLTIRRHRGNSRPVSRINPSFRVPVSISIDRRFDNVPESPISDGVDDSRNRKENIEKNGISFICCCWWVLFALVMGGGRLFVRPQVEATVGRFLIIFSFLKNHFSCSFFFLYFFFFFLPWRLRTAHVDECASCGRRLPPRDALTEFFFFTEFFYSSFDLPLLPRPYLRIDARPFLQQYLVFFLTNILPSFHGFI